MREQLMHPGPHGLQHVQLLPGLGSSSKSRAHRGALVLRKADAQPQEERTNRLQGTILHRGATVCIQPATAASMGSIGAAVGRPQPQLRGYMDMH